MFVWGRKSDSVLVSGAGERAFWAPLVTRDYVK